MWVGRKHIATLGLLLIAAVGQSQKEIPRASITTAGLDSIQVYQQADSIITNGIKNNAFPGAQLLVAYEGKVIFEQAYGFPFLHFVFRASYFEISFSNPKRRTA